MIPCASFLVLPMMLALAACSGVQTGDGGDSGNDCVFSEPVAAPFDQIPEGATESPAVTFAPLLAPIVGVVEGPAGTHAVTATFAVDEPTLTVMYPEGDPVRAECDRVELGVQGTVTFDGEPFIAGQLPATVRSARDQLRTDYDAAALTVKPPTSLGSGARLGVPLQLGMDCRWTGQWRYFAFTSCEGEELCSGQVEEEIGWFVAEGDCE